MTTPKTKTPKAPKAPKTRTPKAPKAKAPTAAPTSAAQPPPAGAEPAGLREHERDPRHPLAQLLAR